MSRNNHSTITDNAVVPGAHDTTLPGGGTIDHGGARPMQRRPFSLSRSSSVASSAPNNGNSIAAMITSCFFRRDEATYQEIQETDNRTSSTTTTAGSTISQAFLHLVKGYVGPGCLSLPWAVSQLGLTAGITCCWLMSAWSSYNCWKVVQLKRWIENKEEEEEQQQQHGDEPTQQQSLPEQRPRRPRRRQLTYPAVAECLCGRQFFHITQTAICIQQLAICTVFFSFVGTNLQAVLQEYTAASNDSWSHGQVMLLALPAILGLSLLPNLSALAPITALGTLLLMGGLAALGVVVAWEWNGDNDSNNDNNGDGNATAASSSTPSPWSTIPLALCAILYSYEGICLILPVESAMSPTKVRRQCFPPTFVAAMITAAAVFSLVAGSCVAAFGKVSNGSITAFLLQEYFQNNDDSAPDVDTDDTTRDRLSWHVVMVANALVSLSVLVTYPLQLFPAVELVEQWLKQRRERGTGQPIRTASLRLDDEEVDNRGAMTRKASPTKSTQQQGDRYQSQFSAATMETAVSSLDSNTGGSNHNHDIRSDVLGSAEPDGIIRDIDDDDDNNDPPSFFYATRIGLVMVTYVIATVVPNVSSLISLAGAVAGSSTALLIPPILQLAWIKQQQHQEHDSLSTSSRSPESFWIEKALNYALLAGGVVFLCIGAIASLVDIARAYSG